MRISLMVSLVLFIVYLLAAIVGLCIIYELRGTHNYERHKILGYIPFKSLVFSEHLNCPICLHNLETDQKVVKLLCNDNKTFHSKCLTQWVKDGNEHCIVCQKVIQL